MNLEEVEVAHHSLDEIANFNSTQKILHGWLLPTDWPSIQIIRELHGNLLHGVAAYQTKGVAPIQPGEFRNEDITVSDQKPNFYVHGNDVSPIIRKYSEDLDILLDKLPKNPEGNIAEIVHDAAWAYYTFIRIHPFLDGNGRTGRFILNRVLNGSGLNSLRFIGSDPQTERDKHLDAMEKVSNTHDLSHLEVYILDKILQQTTDENLSSEISAQYLKKLDDIQKYPDSNRSLDSIWPKFKGLDIHGVPA